MVVVMRGRTSVSSGRARLAEGTIDAAAAIATASPGSALQYVDGGNWVGPAIAWHALQAGMAAARETGVGAVLVRRGNKRGTLPPLSSEAAEQGFAALMTTTTAARTAPKDGWSASGQRAGRHCPAASSRRARAAGQGVLRRRPLPQVPGCAAGSRAPRTAPATQQDARQPMPRPRSAVPGHRRRQRRPARACVRSFCRRAPRRGTDERGSDAGSGPAPATRHRPHAGADRRRGHDAARGAWPAGRCGCDDSARDGTGCGQPVATSRFGCRREACGCAVPWTVRVRKRTLAELHALAGRTAPGPSSSGPNGLRRHAGQPQGGAVLPIPVGLLAHRALHSPRHGWFSAPDRSAPCVSRRRLARWRQAYRCPARPGRSASAMGQTTVSAISRIAWRKTATSASEL